MSFRKPELEDSNEAYVCRILDATCRNQRYGTLRGSARKYSATRIPKSNEDVPSTVYDAVLMLMTQAGWTIFHDYDRYYPCHRYI